MDRRSGPTAGAEPATGCGAGPHETSVGVPAGRLQRWQQATTSRPGSSRRTASGGRGRIPRPPGRAARRPRTRRASRLGGRNASRSRRRRAPRPGRGNARAGQAGVRRAGISPLDRRRHERRPVRETHAPPLGSDPDVLLDTDPDAGPDAPATAVTIGGHRPARPDYPIREEA